MAQEVAGRFLISRGAERDTRAEVLIEPGHHTYEWAAFGAMPMTFTSEADASRFGRAMLANPFHVRPA